MKILFISKPDQADYACDSVLHGLKSLFGPDVVDIHRRWFMYKGAPIDPETFYGRGYTLFALLDEGQVDREDIIAKIKAKLFDLVVFGSIQREFALLGEVRDAYPANKIVLIDGEDNPLLLKNCLGHGIYLKRELHTPHDQVQPIQFGFPEEKIQPLGTKTCLLAPLDPMDLRTYVYKDEKSYYAAYNQALFGKTMKKAGYDCMRHYEIMGCRAIPYFENLEYVPLTIMTRLPKEEMLVAKTMLEYNHGELFLSSAGQRIWEVLEQKIFEKFTKNLTTKALATYVLDVMQKAA